MKSEPIDFMVKEEAICKNCEHWDYGSKIYINNVMYCPCEVDGLVSDASGTAIVFSKYGSCMTHEEPLFKPSDNFMDELVERQEGSERTNGVRCGGDYQSTLRRV